MLLPSRKRRAAVQPMEAILRIIRFTAASQEVNS